MARRNQKLGVVEVNDSLNDAKFIFWPCYTDSDAQRRVLRYVRNERRRQDAKFGPQTWNALKGYAVLGEEFGELGKAVNGDDNRNLEEELVQVAAVAVAWLEQIERQRVTGLVFKKEWFKRRKNVKQ